MTRKKILLIILTITLAFGITLSGCGGGSAGGGSFTLTDIPSKYNGMYALLVGVNITNPKVAYAGYQSSVGKDKNKLCKISNGRVNIPMWIVDSSTEKIQKYSGSDTLSMVSVSIFETETQAKENPENPVDTNVFMSIAFSNGNASKSWDNGILGGTGGALLDQLFKFGR